MTITDPTPTPAGTAGTHGGQPGADQDQVTDVVKALPSGFPSAEVPLVDGTIVGSSTGAAGGPYSYTVLMTAPGQSAKKVMAAAAAKLARAGYTRTPGALDTDQASTSTFKSRRHAVGVNAVRGPDGTISVTYVVMTS
jgi:hypothetical protein